MVYATLVACNIYLQHFSYFGMSVNTEGLEHFSQRPAPSSRTSGKSRELSSLRYSVDT